MAALRRIRKRGRSALFRGVIGRDLQVGVADGEAPVGAGHVVPPRAVCWKHAQLQTIRS